MLWARSVMDDWIGEDGRTPHVKMLTGYFLALYFIMATQVNEVFRGRPRLCWHTQAAVRVVFVGRSKGTHDDGRHYQEAP